jgi:predicted metal-dependent HD superfamily phosphohydrolase
MLRILSTNFLKSYFSIPYLANQWRAAHVAENVIPDWKEFVTLLGAWSEPHRKYHTLPHLVSILKEMDRLGKGLPKLHVGKLTGFFHDYYYDTTLPKGQSEIKSAKKAVEYLTSKNFMPSTVNTVERMIEDSANHGASAARSPLWKVFSDADLAILSSEWNTYLEYVRGVYHEYGQVGLENFVTGRLKFLRGALDKRIYRLPEMRDAETRAKANMNAEIKLLENNPRALVG